MVRVGFNKKCRIFARGAVILGVVVMAFAAMGCEEPLHHSLDEAQANEMVVTLNQEGFEAEKVRDPVDSERWAVAVPGAQRVEAWATLQREGLPRPAAGGFGDFYPGGGLIPTSQEERVVLQYATAREIQTSLLRISGVVDAHVNLVLPDKPRVQMSGNKPAEPRASVLVQWRDRGEGPPVDEEEIRSLVSGGVENLDPQAIRVVMTAISTPEREWTGVETVQVGPIAVAPSSQGTLKVLMLLMGGVIIALSSGLVFVVLKQRGANRPGAVG